MFMEKEYLDRREASEYLTCRGLKTSVASLNKLATTGGGPVFVLFGRLPRYTRDDLDAWAKTRLSPRKRSTSDQVGVAA